MTATETETLPIVIVGAGFSGLGMAIRLKRAGIHDFAILERASRVGGTWRENTYPGCACDVPSVLYSFSFAPNPDWSRTYSPASEIHAYLLRLVRDHDLERHIRFDTDLQGGRWSDSRGRWELDTNHGPNTGLGHNSLLYMIESQIAYVLSAVRTMRSLELGAVEVGREAQRRSNKHIQRHSQNTVWTQGGCNSWYLDAEGKNTSMWPRSTFAYRWRTRRFDTDNYHLYR